MTDIRIKSQRYIKDKGNYTDWSEPNELYRIDCLEIEVVDGKIWVLCGQKTPGGRMRTSHYIPFDTDEAIRIEIGNFQEERALTRALSFFLFREKNSLYYGENGLRLKSHLPNVLK